MNIQLHLVEESDLVPLLEFVRSYHKYEGIELSAPHAEAAIRPLIGQSTMGRVWLIFLGAQPIGYVAICFGYSIEFAGHDAFVDEMFIVPQHRGKGFGKTVLALVKSEAVALGIKALHLEVARTNERAQNLYRSAGFLPRERFFLMSMHLERLMNGELRQALRSDIANMHRVRMAVHENRLVSTVLSEKDYARAIEVSGRGWLVELKGTVVAFAVGNRENASIWALFVEPGHEGNGFGRRLHDTMVTWLWQQGHEELWLTTEPGTRAQRFYESAGWKYVGPTAGGELRYELSNPGKAFQVCRFPAFAVD